MFMYSVVPTCATVVLICGEKITNHSLTGTHLVPINDSNQNRIDRCRKNLRVSIMWINRTTNKKY